MHYCFVFSGIYLVCPAEELVASNEGVLKIKDPKEEFQISEKNDTSFPDINYKFINKNGGMASYTFEVNRENILRGFAPGTTNVTVTVEGASSSCTFVVTRQGECNSFNCIKYCF